MSRSHSENRCAPCGLYRPLCICALAPKLETRTRVLVLMHVRETPLTTNTARLAELALKNAELRVRGKRGEDLDCSDVAKNSEYSPGVLFPSVDAQILSPELVASLGKPLLLVVPDGNWKQTSKIQKRVPGLSELPKFKLPPGPPSEYRLRIAPKPEYVSTFEAILRAVKIAETPYIGPDRATELERVLHSYFKMKVERTLWSRGQLKADQVFGGVPDAAIEAFREAGRRGTALRDERIV